MPPHPQAEAHYQRAVHLRVRGDIRGALEEINSAIAFENQAEYYFERAWAELLLGQTEEAERDMNVVATISEHRPSVRITQEEWDTLALQLLHSKDDLLNHQALFEEAIEIGTAESILVALARKENHGMENLLRASVRLASKGANGAIGESKLGGIPDATDDFEWPEGHDGVPLAFLCQLNFGGLEMPKPSPLPHAGVMYFFYEAKEQPWGYDPYDRGQWKVIFSKKTSGLWPKEAPEDLPAECSFAPMFVRGLAETSLPDFSCEQIAALQPTQSIRECYEEAVHEWYGKEPWHRILGNYQPIQGPMEVECEMAFRGFEQSATLDRGQSISIAAGAKQWRLLLQIDSDDETGMLWGDGGRLYFWIRLDDLKIRNFENIWVILQCY